MAMKRRGFIIALGAMAAVQTADSFQWIRRAALRPWTEAIRTGRYPGPTGKLDRAARVRTGKWAG